MRTNAKATICLLSCYNFRHFCLIPNWMKKRRRMLGRGCSMGFGGICNVNPSTNTATTYRLYQRGLSSSNVEYNAAPRSLLSFFVLFLLLLPQCCPHQHPLYLFHFVLDFYIFNQEKLKSISSLLICSTHSLSLEFFLAPNWFIAINIRLVRNLTKVSEHYLGFNNE